MGSFVRSLRRESGGSVVLWSLTSKDGMDIQPIPPKGSSPRRSSPRPCPPYVTPRDRWHRFVVCGIGLRESDARPNARVARCLLHPGVCRQLPPRPIVATAAWRGIFHVALLLRAPALQVCEPNAVVDEGLCEADLLGTPRAQHGDAREHHGVALHRNRDVHARDRPPVRYYLASRPCARRAGPCENSRQRLRPIRLQHAPPAPDQAQSGLQPRPAWASWKMFWGAIPALFSI